MNPLEPLITSLKKFPGIGEKSAQRLAFFLLSLPKQDVQSMADTMVNTHRSIRYCETCFNLSLEEQCHICRDPRRDISQCCVVAEPRDIFALEKTGAYKGLYHVLGGLISPLDGIQPESLRIRELIDRIKNGRFTEIIFAINATVEGDTTILYLKSVLEAFSVSFTQLAYGLPMGSDIDYVDESTLTLAISSRRAVESVKE